MQASLIGHHESSLDAATRCADGISDVAPQPALSSVGTLSDNSALLRVIEILSRQVDTPRAKMNVLCTTFKVLASAAMTLAPNPGIPTPSGSRLGAADSTREAIQHPPPAGATAATDRSRRSVLNHAPTASREFQRSRHHRGTCLFCKDRLLLHYG